jgi:hypothetical protein
MNTQRDRRKTEKEGLWVKYCIKVKKDDRNRAHLIQHGGFGDPKRENIQ